MSNTHGISYSEIFSYVYCWYGFLFVCLFIKITRDKRESRPSVQILCHCKSCHGLFFVKEVFLEEIAKNVNLLIFGQNI